MASIKEVRDALKSTLDDNIESLSGYPTVQSCIPSGWVLKPESGNFQKAMGRRGHIEWSFALYVLVSSADDTLGQEVLDEIVDPNGSMSIRSVLFDHPDLGLEDGTDAQVTGMSDYGSSFKINDIPHIGAKLHIRVITPGS